MVQGSYFQNGDTRGRVGVQAKGGSTDIVIRDNRFEHAGLRAVQIGGLTGPQYFRPQPPPGYEAKNITARGERDHRLRGGHRLRGCGYRSTVLAYNTIYQPDRVDPHPPGKHRPRVRALPQRRLHGQHHHSVYGTVPTAVNGNSNTWPSTFQFARNWWYNLDNPANSRPSLPSPESVGHYGIDPQFVDALVGDFRLKSGSPAVNAGAYAVRPG